MKNTLFLLCILPALVFAQPASRNIDSQYHSWGSAYGNFSSSESKVVSCDKLKDFSCTTVNADDNTPVRVDYDIFVNGNKFSYHYGMVSSLDTANLSYLHDKDVYSIGIVVSGQKHIVYAPTLKTMCKFD